MYEVHFFMDLNRDVWMRLNINKLQYSNKSKVMSLSNLTLDFMGSNQ